MQINIADDYFHARKESEDLREEIQQKEKDLYDVKHEPVTSQMKLDSTEKKLRQAEKDLDESAKKIIRLETEMKTREEDKRSRG